ncbi:helix-turn-helix domain-containing protein [Pseudonocardia sp. ICBG601]|uniref:MmyB family transcriptional regulator n=1 Tax=Pseudonocardia sp. ICBG601 TaxID=2846759 RepID=UPI001CF61CCB|nr:helix-turn-helix domain-containing protein [Pseudonocardia sp. ICBG601]
MTGTGSRDEFDVEQTTVELPELGRFLRQLRERSLNGCRRAGGMSRMELATLTGHGAGYIAKLEQGGQATPSPAVVDALADALGCSPGQRQHLHDLRDYRPGEGDRPVTPCVITDQNRIYVDTLTPALAGFVDDAWNVLYANSEYRRVYRRIADPDIANVLLWFFFVPESRHIMVEWEQEALLTVSWTRALMVRNHLGGDQFTTLLDQLSHSTEFQKMWNSGDVALGRHKAEMLVRDLDSGKVLNLRAQVLKWPEPASPLQLYLAIDMNAPPRREGFLSLMAAAPCRAGQPHLMEHDREHG